MHSSSWSKVQWGEICPFFASKPDNGFSYPSTKKSRIPSQRIQLNDMIYVICISGDSVKSSSLLGVCELQISEIVVTGRSNVVVLSWPISKSQRPEKISYTYHLFFWSFWEEMPRGFGRTEFSTRTVKCLYSSCSRAGLPAINWLQLIQIWPAPIFSRLITKKLRSPCYIF